MIGKIYPAVSYNKSEEGDRIDRMLSSAWTVWKKSSMAFEGTDGFSVYDSEGKLAFRVHNYSRKHKELVLMDGVGRALLSLRPQILSLHDQWNGFERDDGTPKIKSKSQIFSMRRRSFLHKSNDVEVFMGDTRTDTPDFQIEGSFSRRSCTIRTNSGEVVAEISRKVVSKSVVLSNDVFNLVVHPGVDCKLIMAFVVIMDRICPKPYAPVMCFYKP